MNDFLILIAYYDKGNSFRRRNLKAVIDNYLANFPECDICVAEQNTSDALDGYQENSRLKHINVELDEVFHKTILLNHAVRENPGYKAYVMGDADAYLDMYAIDYIRKHWNEGVLVYPFSNVLYLSETDTRRVLRGEPLTPGPKNHGVQIGRQTGLCNIFTQEIFDKVGGFDESFSAWGAEDDAFLVKCNRLVGIVKRNIEPNGSVLHLYHPVVNTPDYINSDVYLANRKRCACVRRMSDEDLASYVSGAVTMDEMVKKYDSLGRLQVKLNWKCTNAAYLTIDTTIYDLDYSTEMSFSKIIAEVKKEDGPEYAVHFIDSILKPIPDLSEEQLKELDDNREELCNIVRTLAQNSSGQN